MKKLLLLGICVCLLAAWRPSQKSMQRQSYQKQIWVDNVDTCQAFRIHPHWFATAAHCVESCLDGNCRVKILLAQGDVTASAELSAQDVRVPKEYRTVDKEKRVRTHKVWDIALLHYRPQEILYEYTECVIPHTGCRLSTRAEFEQALQEDANLEWQWSGAIDPKIPVLYTYDGPDLMKLKSNLMVPRWDWGNYQVLFDPQTVLYFGENSALWGTDGFGVDHGNSGGAVVLPDGGVVGVAAAKADNQLPAFVRQVFPTFGQANEFFLFVGFAPKTTLQFIQDTLLPFGDRVQTKKLRRIEPVQPAL